VFVERDRRLVIVILAHGKGYPAAFQVASMMG
jgi:hypothetical protein